MTLSVLVSGLPVDPAKIPVTKMVDACRQIYECQDQIIGAIDADDAVEALRRAGAIEKYLKDKEHKAEASYAARVLEAAVGAALGPAEENKGGRGNKPSIMMEGLQHTDRYHFRQLYEKRHVWSPLIDKKFRPDKKHMSRREALKRIEAANKPQAEGEGTARIKRADAVEWLGQIHEANLLLTDPPYSTDVDNVHEFVSWMPLALSKLKPSGRAFVFIGAYAEELQAYFSSRLPKGWTWGVPHAWCYRNTIGPTPKYDFIRNWQCVLSAYGPDAGVLGSDRITELLAGFTENAPDGRRDIKHHKWEKPMGLVRRLIRISTHPDDTVIDPFAGSGTTLLAAKYEGRHSLGCDIDSKAVKTAKKRGCDG